jgi:succinate dehydrogenase / fumarate reductase, cytochrome b subunit
MERFVGHGRTNYADLSDAMSHPWYFAFYIVGVTAASFHLGNGLWNFACKWGIAVTAKSQRAFGWLGAGLTVTLTFVGIAIALGFHYHWFPLGTYVQ